MTSPEGIPTDLVEDIDTFLDKNKHSDEAYEYALGVLEALGHTSIYRDMSTPEE